MFSKISKVLLWIGVAAGVVVSIVVATIIPDGKGWWIFPVGVIVTLVLFSSYGTHVEMVSNIKYISECLSYMVDKSNNTSTGTSTQSIGWKCPTCGEENDKYSLFCQGCGNKKPK